jgi:hypothetical protein
VSRTAREIRAHLGDPAATPVAESGTREAASGPRVATGLDA